MNLFKAFSRNNIKRNYKRNKEEEEEKHVLSTATSYSTGIQKSRATLVSTNLLNETNLVYQYDITLLFKEIDDRSVRDEEIINRITNLINQDDTNVRRIKSSRIGNEQISLLHTAAKSNRAQLCHFLMDKLRFDPNILCKRSFKTPLHFLINTTNEEQEIDECFNVFVQHNADPNHRDDTKSSLLHYAIKKNNIHLVSLLLNTNKINLNIENDRSLTPLHLACELGAEEIALLLAKHTSDYYLLNNKNNQFKKLPLHSAVSCNHKEQIELFKHILNRLNSSNIDLLLTSLDDSSKTILELAIENNHLNIVDFLLSLNTAKFNTFDLNGNLPIHYAAKNGTAELFSLLEKHNLIPFESNLNDESPLHIATIYNRFIFVKMILLCEKMDMIKNDDNSSYLPMSKRINKLKYTPLQIAIIKGHEKCVEELTNSSQIDLDIKTSNNYSIYHLCVYYNNLESLRYLLNKKSDKYLDPIFIRSKNENETPIHLACRTGQLEAIKLILIKLTNSRHSNLVETFLRERNKLGQTCFHLACYEGYYNIIEYFLKDFKVNFFLELCDYQMNTCLLNATEMGHFKICQILLENGADLNATNINYKNALLISCEMKHFDISKLLIKYHSGPIEVGSHGFHPIHIASYEGAHEVVELLLEKNVPIDLLSDTNENCLDIAIEQEKQDCIKVLLRHPNWTKLFISLKKEDTKFKSIKDRIRHKSLTYVSKLRRVNDDLNSDQDEHPQFVALFEKKMWNIFEIILNNCVIINEKERKYNLSVLDPPAFNNINRHPLMLLTRSGQENLLMHEITGVLLNLKWRFLPRLCFYSNMLLNILFLMFFVFYSSELIEYKNREILNDDCYIYKLPLIIVSSIKLTKVILQILLMDGLAFFFTIQSWLDVITLMCTFLTMLEKSYSIRSTYCSVGMMAAFLTFTFLIEKLNIFGLYVLAFRRTILNSAKFLPVFLVIYLGFVLSFRTRTAANISYFNDTTSSSLIKGLTMMLGDFKTDQMGLNNSMVNYLLYLLFIVLVSIIVLNLFVGIAVGEVSTVLAEATVQQISIRIIFVLKLQFALKFTQNFRFFDRLLGMTYQTYDYNLDEPRLSKAIDKLINKLKIKLLNKNAGINLIDPNSRLEEKISNLYLKTDFDCKQIKDVLALQINEVELKFQSSHQRLEDYLTEMSRKSINNFESTKDDSNEKLNLVEASLLKSQTRLQTSLFDLKNFTSNKLVAVKQSFVQMIHNLEMLASERNKKLSDLFGEFNEKTNTVNEHVQLIDLRQKNEFGLVKNNFDLMDSRMNLFQVEMSRLVKALENIEGKLNIYEYKLNVIEILNRKETFSAKLDLTMQKIEDLMQRQFSLESTLAKIKT